MTWELVKCIYTDRGNGREVWSAYSQTTGRYAAVKQINSEMSCNGASEMEKGIMEAVKSIGHPYLPELLYCTTEQSHLLLFMPLYSASLMNYIQWHENNSDPQCDMLCAAEIVHALGFLHSCGIVHADIKPDDVLIDMGGHVVLIDFGNSFRQKTGKHFEPAEVGTDGYMAPEIIDKRAGAFDFPMDIWSLGVTILEMVLKVSNYYFSPIGWKKEASKRKVRDGSFADKIMNPDLRDLLRKMVVESPAARLTVVGIKKHPYFSSVDWEQLHRKAYEAPAHQLRVQGFLSSLRIAQLTSPPIKP